MNALNCIFMQLQLQFHYVCSGAIARPLNCICSHLFLIGETP